MKLTEETFKHILLPVYISTYKFKGKRFDCGSVEGYLEATNYFAKTQGINNI